MPEDAPDMLFYDSLNGLQYGGRINIKSIPVTTTEPPPAVPPLRLPPDNLYVYDTSSVSVISKEHVYQELARVERVILDTEFQIMNS